MLQGEEMRGRGAKRRAAWDVLSSGASWRMASMAGSESVAEVGVFNSAAFMAGTNRKERRAGRECKEGFRPCNRIRVGHDAYNPEQGAQMEARCLQ